MPFVVVYPRKVIDENFCLSFEDVDRNSDIESRCESEHFVNSMKLRRVPNSLEMYLDGTIREKNNKLPKSVFIN